MHPRARGPPILFAHDLMFSGPIVSSSRAFEQVAILVVDGHMGFLNVEGVAIFEVGPLRLETLPAGSAATSGDFESANIAGGVVVTGRGAW